MGLSYGKGRPRLSLKMQCLPFINNDPCVEGSTSERTGIVEQSLRHEQKTISGESHSDSVRSHAQSCALRRAGLAVAVEKLYRRIYGQPDRVIDHHAGDRTTSEGQA